MIRLLPKLWAIFGTLLIPIAVFSYWTAKDAAHEPDRFRLAKEAGKTQAKDGDLLKITGNVEYTALRTDGLPSNKKALQYSLRREKRHKKTGNWVVDRDFDVKTARAKEVKVDRQTIVLGDRPRIFYPIQKQVEPIDENSRYQLQWITLDEPVTVYGTYLRGLLVEGRSQRVYVVKVGEESKFFEELERRAETKSNLLTLTAWISGGLALFLLALALIFAIRNQQHPGSRSAAAGAA